MCGGSSRAAEPPVFVFGVYQSGKAPVSATTCVEGKLLYTCLSAWGLYLHFFGHSNLCTVAFVMLSCHHELTSPRYMYACDINLWQPRYNCAECSFTPTHF